MAKWSELPARTQWAVIGVAVVAITALSYFFVCKPIADQNTQTGQQLAAVKAENDSLRPYRDKLTDLERQIESLKQQLEIQKRIVPDEKEADTFIRMVQATAASAGIEIRSYTSKPTASKEFFVEAPFDINIDGPYYSVVNFFDKMAKLDRIINVSGLQMAGVEAPGQARVRKTYKYSAGETVVASCTATTYFSRDAAAAAQPAAKKK